MTTQDQWGRFTLRGGEEVEACIRALVQDVARAAEQVLTPSEYRALVLLGGYGRGEGGVETRDGLERPHNNLDFMLITHNVPAWRQEEMKTALRKRLDALVHAYGVDMDLSVTSTAHLARTPCLVMWYDMRFGHKIVTGRSDYVASLTRFSLDRIPAWDVRNLFVNRGVLLAINEHILAGKNLDLDARRLVVKHTMKAIIGYGDALLFFLGDYDWSYAEKQRRMRARTDVAQEFKALYDQALDFRFAPDYEPWLGKDLHALMVDLRTQLEPIGRLCEAKRLDADALEWHSYPSAFLRHALLEDALSPIAWAKKARNLMRSAAPPAGLDMLSGVGFRMMGERALPALLFPLVAYQLDGTDYRTLAANALKCPAKDMDALRGAYLRLWGRYNNVDIPAMIGRWRPN